MYISDLCKSPSLRYFVTAALAGNKHYGTGFMPGRYGSQMEIFCNSQPIVVSINEHCTFLYAQVHNFIKCELFVLNDDFVLCIIYKIIFHLVWGECFPNGIKYFLYQAVRDCYASKERSTINLIMLSCQTLRFPVRCYAVSVNLVHYSFLVIFD